VSAENRSGLKHRARTPDTLLMRVLASPEARRLLRERGGMLFVRIRRAANVRAAVRTLVTSTEPPGAEALDFQRFDAGDGLFVFLPPGIRPPRELHLEARGWFRRRIDAFWNGCVHIVPEPGLN
jgi:hypothetical protein